jgi:sugar fermentation stimulation protein A
MIVNENYSSKSGDLCFNSRSFYLLFDSGVISMQLYPAQLLRRYKRFLADVRLPCGAEIVIHCPNTGSMKNCVLADSPCWYSLSDSKTRKYPQTLEVVTVPGGHWAGINSARANALVQQALAEAVIAELQGYQTQRAEVRYGQEQSRIDFLLSDHPQDERLCYLEVKSVTLMESEGQGFFPDAVSERGAKHLRELMQMRQQGHRAVLLFCVQHTGIKQVSPADHIDARYGETLRAALSAGVEVIAYGAAINPALGLLRLTEALPLRV